MLFSEQLKNQQKDYESEISAIETEKSICETVCNISRYKEWEALTKHLMLKRNKLIVDAIYSEPGDKPMDKFHWERDAKLAQAALLDSIVRIPEDRKKRMEEIDARLASLRQNVEEVQKRQGIRKGGSNAQG